MRDDTESSACDESQGGQCDRGSLLALYVDVNSFPEAFLTFDLDIASFPDAILTSHLGIAAFPDALPTSHLGIASFPMRS